MNGVSRRVKIQSSMIESNIIVELQIGVYVSAF